MDLHVMLIAEPPAVDFGKPVRLSWQAPRGANCHASGGWNGDRNASGTEQVLGLTGDTTFLLSCSTGQEASVAKLLVEVRDVTPDLEFWVAEQQVPLNQGTTLHWNAVGADLCEANGGWLGQHPTSGQFETGPLAKSTLFGLSCQSRAGTAISTVSVSVQSSTASAGNRQTISGSQRSS
jgi:hypothetical protein